MSLTIPFFNLTFKLTFYEFIQAMLPSGTLAPILIGFTLLGFGRYLGRPGTILISAMFMSISLLIHIFGFWSVALHLDDYYVEFFKMISFKDVDIT